MKKLFVTLLAAALLVVPMGMAASAENVEASQPQAEAYVPGSVPAQMSVQQVMEPALDGVLMAMISRNVNSFDSADRDLVWESLYNMLSLYGQMDLRSEYQGEDLLVPSETVRDYAAALTADVTALGQLPEFLSDRMTYLADSDSYLVACGSAGLSALETQISADGAVSGQLLFLEDDSVLASFTAQLQPGDNMFGWTVASMELA